MKRLIALSLLLLLATATAFAHAGHAHTYLGKVTMLHGSTEFMMNTTDGKELTINTTPQTSWQRADGHAAKKSELAVGSRVVVKMTTDAKSAASVKMSAPATKR
jgi:hypothetical protein